MNNADRLRALLAKPDFVCMPAVWDGLSAKLTHDAGFETATPLRLLRGGKPARRPRSRPAVVRRDARTRCRWSGAPHPSCWHQNGDHGYGNAMNMCSARSRLRPRTRVLIEDKITPRALTAAGKPCLHARRRA